MPDACDIFVTVPHTDVRCRVSGGPKNNAPPIGRRMCDEQAGVTRGYCRVSDCAAVGQAESLPQWPSQTRQRHS